MAEQFVKPPHADRDPSPPADSPLVVAAPGSSAANMAKTESGEPPRPVSSSSRARRRDSGFEGQLKRAKLADLVQLECLSGAREAVAISSDGRRGHLFFEAGAVVHARTASHVGNAAALEILSWTRGTFGQSPLPWPGHHTITLTWQELLIQSGQTSEGSQVGPNPSSETSTLSSGQDITAATKAKPVETSVAGPAPQANRMSRSTSAVRRSYVESKANWGRPQARPSERPPPPSTRPAARRRPATRAALLVDRGGNVIARQGDTTELEGNTHALQLALDALGEALGLNAFIAFECTLPERKMMMFRNANGNTVTVETPPGAKLKEVRASLER